MRTRARRAGGVALLIALLCGTAVAVAFARQPRPSLPAVYALDPDSHLIRSGGRVGSREALTIVASGFAASTRIEVVDGARQRINYIHADPTGTVRTRFEAPAAGAGFVALVGLVRDNPSAQASGGAGPGDPQTLSVDVPLLRRFDYRLGDSGVLGIGVGRSSGGSGPSGARSQSHGVEGIGATHGGGPLAGTGADVLEGIVLAMILLAIGTLVVLTARRRRAAPTQDRR